MGFSILLNLLGKVSDHIGILGRHVGRQSGNFEAITAKPHPVEVIDQIFDPLPGVLVAGFGMTVVDMAGQDQDAGGTGGKRRQDVLDGYGSGAGNRHHF